VWRRPGAADFVTLPLPAFRGRDLSVGPFFPSAASGWDWTWDAGAGDLTITAVGTAPSARVLIISSAVRRDL